MALETKLPVTGTGRPRAAEEGSLRRRALAAARLAGLAIVALDLALFIAGVPVRVAERAHPAPPVHAALAGLGLTPTGYALITLALDLAVLALFAGSGLVLLWRARATPMPLLAGLTLVGLGVVVLTDEASAYNARSPLLMAVTTGLALATMAPAILFFYTFPDGHFVPRWTRWAALAWLAFFSLFTLFSAVLNPQRWPLPLYLVAVAALWGTVPVAQIVRYRRVSDPAQRQQTKWVAYGIAAGIGGLVATWIVGVALFGGTDTPSAAIGLQLLGRLAQVLWLSAIPVCVALAVLRRRLWDIDLVINRTLVYATLTALVGGLYVLLVSGLGTLVPARGHLFASLVATGLIAALFGPLRLWVQRAVNRLLYGQRDEPYAVLARLGTRLDASLAPETVLPTLVETVRDALRLPYAAVTLAEDPAGGVASGDPGAAAVLTVPLTYQGAPVGALRLAPRRGMREFGPADRRLLDDLAHHAGAAVHGVRLQRELQQALQALQASRERLVTAREEERRRLRRDLHDELAPTLAALALTAGTAGDLLSRDAATAGRLIAMLEEALRQAVGQVRRLVDDLRPPALDELGLEGALRERAAQVGGADAPEHLRVVVEAPRPLPPLPAAVEVAAYRIAQEALMNVVKHARARVCTIRLAVEDAPRILRVEIADDGVGVPERPHAGVGLGSMRERAGELGGACTITPGVGGGTCVAACLPLPIPETREEGEG